MTTTRPSPCPARRPRHDDVGRAAARPSPARRPPHRLRTARAAPTDCAGRGVPASKVSIQLWTFVEYVGCGADSHERLRTVLSELASFGYRNVEPYSLHGYTAQQYAALLQEYGLKASARHVDVGTPEAPVDITQVLEENRVLGITHFGSGGTPRTRTEAAVDRVRRVPEHHRRAGAPGRSDAHGAQPQLGVRRCCRGTTGYDLLLAHTDPRNVTFQLDVYWAELRRRRPGRAGRGVRQPHPAAHVKDLRDLGRRIEIVGPRRDIDFPSIFAAGGGGTKYFVVEHDPRRNDPTFDPFEAAEVGFDYLDCVTY